MLFLETLPMAWKLRETTFFQAAAYEPAPAVPRLATVLPLTEVRFAHRVKPGLKRRQKAEGRRQKAEGRRQKAEGRRRGTWGW